MSRAMHRRARARRGASGFTLVELVISLVAGLMVAMAVMGISKEATNTFHEEVRISAAEMGLRVAMERIRLDLQRAAFMGTANLIGDPSVAHLANYTTVTPPVNLSNFSGAVLPYSLLNLSGVSVYPGGVTPGAGVAVPSTVVGDATAAAQLAVQAPVLAPDAIDIAGNMSSSDEYAASIVWGPPLGPALAVPAGCAGTVAISLEMTSPAGWRIRNAEALGAAASGAYVAGTALQAVFHPGSSTSSAFMLRVTDQSGLSQYVLGCAGVTNAATYVPGATAAAVPTAMLYLAPGSTLIPATKTGGHGGIGGYGAGLVTVSPLQIARWSIQTPLQFTTAAATAAAPNTYFFNQTAAAVNDATNFLLTRSYLDMSTACTSGAPCPVDPFTTEVISEYAVDLKFGLTVDSFANPNCGAFPCSTQPPTYTTNPLKNIPMDSAASLFAGWGAVEGVYTTNLGPQRIRDVQVRVGIRSPFGDRAASLPVPPYSAVPNGYLYRYLLTSASARFQAGTPYARVREATTEVNLPNQSRTYW